MSWSYSAPEIGAGDGNRTRVSSLGSWCSTIELHPRTTTTLAAWRPGRCGERTNRAQLWVGHRFLSEPETSTWILWSFPLLVLSQRRLEGMPMESNVLEVNRADIGAPGLSLINLATWPMAPSDFRSNASPSRPTTRPMPSLATCLTTGVSGRQTMTRLVACQPWAERRSSNRAIPASRWVAGITAGSRLRSTSMPSSRPHRQGFETTDPIAMRTPPCTAPSSAPTSTRHIPTRPT